MLYPALRLKSPWAMASLRAEASGPSSGSSTVFPVTLRTSASQLVAARVAGDVIWWRKSIIGGPLDKPTMLFDSTLRRDLARTFGATLVVIITIVLTMMLIRTLGR